MFQRAVVPIDLKHAENLKKARAAAIDLAAHYGAEVRYVGVTSALPGALAHTPDEFEAKLKQLAEDDAAGKGVAVSAQVIVSHDPTADLEKSLLDAIRAADADLVVMGTHVPNLGDGFWSSNGALIARHAPVSVFLIRAV
ncbi:universal stress protein [Roseibium polysiphoniae]|uniref:Universal stress protein n=1 Tax=Roseibium polysiphoniae TaxID=2571221 RepID=A0ABR9CA33_9HYPH|nr:universal stress protein [Roseibium polysiphoniae]MBD8876735.1 universal stress protein [Roseibium polysiphoniae]